MARHPLATERGIEGPEQPWSREYTSEQARLESRLGRRFATGDGSAAMPLYFVAIPLVMVGLGGEGTPAIPWLLGLGLLFAGLGAALQWEEHVRQRRRQLESARAEREWPRLRQELGRAHIRGENLAELLQAMGYREFEVRAALARRVRLWTRRGLGKRRPAR